MHQSVEFSGEFSGLTSLVVPAHDECLVCYPRFLWHALQLAAPHFSL